MYEFGTTQNVTGEVFIAQRVLLYVAPAVEGSQK